MFEEFTTKTSHQVSADIPTPVDVFPSTDDESWWMRIGAFGSKLLVCG